MCVNPEKLPQVHLNLVGNAIKFAAPAAASNCGRGQDDRRRGSTLPPGAGGEPAGSAVLWDIIGPMFERVMDAGEETSVVDFLLPLTVGRYN